ncbi:hypothetical protein BCU68_01265 [Vibrio sp. 10N.286.49.B3]|uniref:ABC transporter substrate-binding protein n=1 Tax=Vibrio sp. 10N.286.49.B3 TaxID=1880855 RepID=UPI000C8360AD|nr:ABC transporter substrate-binding protein [Vibrio sp. 10N.286.49.B3]PMH46693.1 hypothetical protein BCU68_01265 [Vibrio sp. 10N.286.49.B3]
MKRLSTLIMGFCLSVPTLSFADSHWEKIEAQAKGQTVYFHAWGGSPEINRYLQWASKRLSEQYGVILKHVKVTDIAETTTRLLAEKSVDKDTNGSVDMVWINGENFKSMKHNELLFGPFTEQLANWKYVDKSLPIDRDFSVPTEGLEAPWGVGQLVFINDNQSLKNPPHSFAELLSYAQAYPNKISYPRPPEFHGTSFLKALLIELTDNSPELSQAVNADNFAELTQPLWQYLDKLHAVAWRQGKQFPAGTAQTIQMLDDGQLDLAVTFNPNAVFSSQANGTLAPSTQSYAFSRGALSNIHFLAIPWNSDAKAGAQVAINFLLSPEAQSRKGDLSIWGDPSVLQNQYLTGSAKKTRLFKSLPEPHPSWQQALEDKWQQRYGH